MGIRSLFSQEKAARQVLLVRNPVIKAAYEANLSGITPLHNKPTSSKVSLNPKM